MDFGTVSVIVFVLFRRLGSIITACGSPPVARGRLKTPGGKLVCFGGDLLPRQDAKTSASEDNKPGPWGRKDTFWSLPRVGRNVSCCVIFQAGSLNPPDRSKHVE